MKRSICFLAATLILLSLTACDTGEGAPDTFEPTATVSITDPANDETEGRDTNTGSLGGDNLWVNRYLFGKNALVNFPPIK